MMRPNGNAVLCYVHRRTPWAWFTTCPLNYQWGDDWDDAPYEHNAEPPYPWSPHYAKPSGRRPALKPYELFRVAFDGFDPPCAGYGNTPWSVQQINAGATPWLYAENIGEPVCIFAGTTYREFLRLVAKAGGSVYEPRERRKRGGK